MKQDIIIKTTVEVPDPIEEVYVVSIRCHGSWGRFRADEQWSCPEVFTNPEAARDYMNKMALFHYHSIAKEVEAVRGSYHVKPEAFLSLSAWEATYGVSDGIAKRYSDMPFLVEYFIHSTPIDRWAKGDKSKITI